VALAARFYFILDTVDLDRVDPHLYNFGEHMAVALTPGGPTTRMHKEIITREGSNMYMSSNTILLARPPTDRHETGLDWRDRAPCTTIVALHEVEPILLL